MVCVSPSGGTLQAEKSLTGGNPTRKGQWGCQIRSLTAWYRGPHDSCKGFQVLVSLNKTLGRGVWIVAAQTTYRERALAKSLIGHLRSIQLFCTGIVELASPQRGFQSGASYTLIWTSLSSQFCSLAGEWSLSGP